MGTDRREFRAVIRPAGGVIGQHSEQILSDLLAMKRDEIDSLRAEGVLA